MKTVKKTAVGKKRTPPTRSAVKARQQMPIFDLAAELKNGGSAGHVVDYAQDDRVFTQGANCESVFYLLSGAIKLSVLSRLGKEAVVAMLGPGDVFGEGALTGQPQRIATATATTPSAVLVIDKRALAVALQQQHGLSGWFIKYMLARNLRIEADLVDQLFNSSEKRLARTLLLLARYGQLGTPENVLPNISQTTLAEMVGTTRSRVNFFMNKFKRLGFIAYHGAGLIVDKSLLSVVLHD